MTAAPGLLAATWPGPFASEARAAYERARNAGLSAARALVLGCIASFKQCWTFRRALAAHTGVSVRTVQRAITQGKAEGLLGTARAKANEVPPGRKEPVRCGWSHRWIVGWGEAVDKAKAAVERARMKRLARQAVLTPQDVRNVRPPNPRQRRYTVEELAAELERYEAEIAQRPPAKPPP